MIDILLVEDHQLVRDGITALLDNEPNFCVKAIASDTREALALFEQGLQVTLVLTDIDLGNKDGIELTRELTVLYPQTKVIILSMLDHEDYIQKAFAAGAQGYLVKTVPGTELLFAIRHVAAGYTYLASSLANLMMKKRSLFYIVNERTMEKADLSARECEVLKMVATGMTNNQIADKLFSSRRTVEGHRQKLLNKTGAKNTAELIRFAIQHRIIKEE